MVYSSDEPDIWMKRVSGMGSVLFPDTNVNVSYNVQMRLALVNVYRDFLACVLQLFTLLSLLLCSAFLCWFSSMLFVKTFSV